MIPASSGRRSASAYARIITRIPSGRTSEMIAPSSLTTDRAADDVTNCGTHRDTISSVGRSTASRLLLNRSATTSGRNDPLQPAVPPLTTRLATIAGCRAASSSARAAPNELPTRCGRSSPSTAMNVGQGVGVVGDAERRWRRRRSAAAGRVPGHDRPLVRERELVPPHPVIAEEAVEQEEWAPLADTLIGDLAAIDLDTPQGVLTFGHRHHRLPASRDGTPTARSSRVTVGPRRPPRPDSGDTRRRNDTPATVPR